MVEAVVLWVAVEAVTAAEAVVAEGVNARRNSL